MPTTVTVTKRKIKNVETGVDISVPSHQTADSPRNVKDYHVIVISNLPHFKLPQHDEDDTVQFMVPRDYAAFEKLQKDVLQQFPDLKLPELPRKYVLFMSEEDVEDRQVSFDCLMTVIARNKELCTSIALLEFLGIDLLADRKYKKRRPEYLKKQKTEKEEEEAMQKQLKDDDFDIFGEKNESSSLPSGNGSNSQPSEKYMLSTDDTDPDLTEDDLFDIISQTNPKKITTKEEALIAQDEQRSAKISLLDDDIDLTPTILMTEHESSEKTLDSNIFSEEDNSELLNVTDTIDDVLKITEYPKQTTKKPSKPKTRPLKSTLFDEDSDESGAVMGKSDIMKYIQQNQMPNDDDDLDLFS